MTSKNLKILAVVSFGVLYFLSFWLLTVGYFTPNWLQIDSTYYRYKDKILEEGYNVYSSNLPWGNASSCSCIGVVTRKCDDNVYSWFTRHNIYDISILANAFRLMTSAIVVVYTNAALLIVAIIFDMIKSPFYMSLLSISFGVLYPVAAILILVASIYVEVWFTWDTGFSAIICTVAGVFMLMFYVGLILYDRQYVMRSMTPSTKIKSPKQKPRSNGSDKHHLSKPLNSHFATNFNKNGISPVREWGLRRL